MWKVTVLCHSYTVLNLVVYTIYDRTDAFAAYLLFIDYLMHGDVCLVR